MPQLHHKAPPSYRKHKQSGAAVVTLYDSQTGKRRDFMLGDFDSTESRARYAETVAAWERRGRRLTLEDPARPATPEPGAIVLVSEALLAYMTDLERRCRRPDGTTTMTIADTKITAEILAELCGTKPMAEFDAGDIEALRDALIAQGRVRPQISKRVRQARGFYRWCVGRRYIPDSVNVWMRLEEMRQRCRPLAPGEFGVREGKKIIPPDPKHVEAALAHLPPMPRAIIAILRWTGARPSEILNMRPRELDRSDATWLLRPEWHKSLKKGRERAIYFPQQARDALTPWLLGVAKDDLIFSARRAEEKRLRDLRDRRKTPLFDSHVAHLERKRVSNPKRKAGERYVSGALFTAVRRACHKARVPTFSPYSLRHLRAAELRKSHGMEVARAVLGHSAQSMTDGYSRQADAELARQAALAVG